MNCTCSKNIYPCPIHGDGLPVSEVVNHECIVVRVHRHRRMRHEDHHWAADGLWYTTVTVDAFQVFASNDHDNKYDALTEAINFIYRKNQKPKE